MHGHSLNSSEIRRIDKAVNKSNKSWFPGGSPIFLGLSLRRCPGDTDSSRLSSGRWQAVPLGWPAQRRGSELSSSELLACTFVNCHRHRW